MGINVHALAAVFVKLILGSGNYFMQKMMARSCGYAEYYDGTILIEPKHKNHCPDGQTSFEKAFFLSTIVFISMLFSVPLFYFWRRKHVPKASYNKRMMLLMIIPAVFETIAFCLGTFAQILMALSLAMIMKGAKVVFSALFTVTFLKRKLLPFHWAAVGVCVGGLVVAGGSEYLNNSDNAGTIVLGTCLMLACECFKAFHVIFDEKMFKSNKCDVTFVVGIEGIYGTILLIPALLIAWLGIKGNDGGSFENLPDTFYRIKESNWIIGILSIYPITVFVVTIAGAMITKHLSGVHNALISVARSIVIWALELIFHYCASPELANQYGHKWDQYTYLKLIGFILVILATLMYDEDVKFPCLFNYPLERKKSPLYHATEESSSEEMSSECAAANTKQIEREVTSTGVMEERDTSNSALDDGVNFNTTTSKYQ